MIHPLKMFLFFILLSILSSNLSHAVGRDGTRPSPAPSEPELAFPEADRSGEKNFFYTDLDMGEQINLDTGELSFYVTDVSLPGSSSLPVQFGRRLSPRYYLSEPALRTYFGFGVQSWVPDIPMITGVVSKDYYDGTTTTAGSVWPGVPYLGGTRQFWKGLYLVIPGESPKKLLWSRNNTSESQKGYQFVTEDYWIVKRTITSTTVTFEALSPRGEKYVFNHALRKPTTTGFGIVAATRATDVNGNWVQYEYNGPILSSAPSSFNRSISRIYSNDGRQLNINYTSSANSANTYIRTVVANGRQWTYQISGGSLSRVTLPDSTYWQYTNLDNTSDNTQTKCSYSTSKVVNATAKHPTGISTSYQLRYIYNGKVNPTTTHSTKPASCTQPYRHPTTNESINFGHASLAVHTKSVTMPRGASQTWQYSYQQDFGATGSMHGLSDTKWRLISRPDGSKERLHFNRVWGWQSGQLIKREQLDSASQVIESTTNTYLRSSTLWEPIAGTTSTSTDADIARTTALTQRSRILLNGETYTTEYFYRHNPLQSNFDFGQPYEVREYSTLQSLKRIHTTTFKHLKTPWVLNLPEKYVRNGKEFERLGFDSRGRVVWLNRFGERKTSYAYYNNGLVSQITRSTDSGQAAQRFQLSSYKLGSPRVISFADGTRITRAIDNNGWITSQTDENGNTRSFSYDSMGRMTNINLPGSWYDTSISYSQLGNGLVQTLTTGNQRTTTQYDGLMRPVLETQTALNGDGVTRYLKTSYDTMGRVTFKSLPSTSSNPTIGMSMQYDAIGRILRERDTASPFASTSYQYLTDNRTRVTDPEGNVTTTTFAGFANAQDGYQTLIESPLNVKTQMTHDNYGNVRTIRQYGTQNGYSTDATQHYYYDNQLRLCRLRTPETGDTVYSYYKTDEVRATAKGLSSYNGCATPSGSTLSTFSYDARNRVTLQNFSASSTPDIHYGYDDAGNLTSLNRGGANWSYTYDDLNHLRSETLRMDGRVWGTQYHYRRDRNIEGVTYPTGRRVNYALNAYGQIKGASSGSQTYASNMRYHANGLWSEVRYGNGHTTYQSINSQQLPSRRWTQHSSRPRVMDLTYTYDKNQNVTSISNGVTSSDSMTMTYDGLQRLLTATDPFGASSFKYDALGNLRQKRLGSRTVNVNYASNNRVSSASSNSGGISTATSGAFSSNYQYDSRGNTTHSGRLGFTYDTADQPTRIHYPGGDSTYRYDGNLRRVKQTTDKNGVTTTYSIYSLAGVLLHRHDVTNNVKTDYVTLGLGSSGSVRIENNQVEYIHLDQLGSPVAETSQSGNVTWRERYTPFGEQINNPSHNANNQSFTGHVSDVDTGLVYMQARYYDPVIGRFYSNDPVGILEHLSGTGGIHGFNRYAYANNNPYKYIDPNGQEPKTPITIIRYEGQPLVLEGPYRAKPNIKDVAFNKVVKKVSGGFFKWDAARDLIRASSKGFAGLLFHTEMLDPGTCKFGPGTCGEEIRPLWSLVPEALNQDSEDSSDSENEDVGEPIAIPSYINEGRNHMNAFNSRPIVEDKRHDY